VIDRQRNRENGISKSFEPNSRLYSDVHKHGYKKEMFAFWVCIGLT